MTGWRQDAGACLSIRPQAPDTGMDSQAELWLCPAVTRKLSQGFSGNSARMRYNGDPQLAPDEQEPAPRPTARRAFATHPRVPVTPRHAGFLRLGSRPWATDFPLGQGVGAPPDPARNFWPEAAAARKPTATGERRRSWFGFHESGVRTGQTIRVLHRPRIRATVLVLRPAAPRSQITVDVNKEETS